MTDTSFLLVNDDGQLACRRVDQGLAFIYSDRPAESIYKVTLSFDGVRVLWQRLRAVEGESVIQQQRVLNHTPDAGLVNPAPAFIGIGQDGEGDTYLIMGHPLTEPHLFTLSDDDRYELYQLLES